MLSCRAVIICLVSLCCCVQASAEESVRAPRKPANLILLVVDDLGYGELGSHRKNDIPTPNLDALASEGVRFTNAYVTAPFCAPSRAGLMTGRYQTRFGYELNPIGVDNDDPRVGIPVTERILAQTLYDAGYATSLVGKWHLGSTPPHHPYRRGFEEFFGFLHEGHYYTPPPFQDVVSFLRRKSPPNRESRWTSRDGKLILSRHTPLDEFPYDANNPILRGSQPVEEALYLTEAFTREAVDFIQRSQDRPYFLCVTYNAVHSPMQARLKDMERFADIEDVHRRVFAGLLFSLDESIGEILQAVKESGQEEQTLIAFLSDNGGATEELTSSNAPLRSGKGDLYEGGIRVPMLMKWTGTLPAGEVVDDPVISLDLYPTFAAAAQRQTAAYHRSIDGINLLPRLSEQSTPVPDRNLFWKMGPKRALRHGDWKVIRGHDPKNLEAWELYNLNEDISESVDLAAEHPERLQDLVQRWEALNEEMVPPQWERGRKPASESSPFRMLESK